MRINKIVMNGFGKFNDASYDLHAPITLFYGHNEAGKSTIMGFIRTMLFGFPTRTYMKDRYEPLRGGLHGGMIIMTDDEGHSYRIERYDGAGATTSALPKLRVTLDDGTVEGEDYLHKLLGEMSADVFQNLFAFSLSELQEISTLQSDEISGYLFNAGTGAGAKTILDAEKKLTLEMDQLFRPRGQIQPINKLVGELGEAQEQLNSSKASLEKYNERTEELRQCDVQIVQMEQALELEQAQLTWFEQCLKVHEDWTLLRSFQRELDDLGGMGGLGEFGGTSRSTDSSTDSLHDGIRRASGSGKNKYMRITLGLNALLPAILLGMGQWSVGIASFVILAIINGLWLRKHQLEKDKFEKDKFEKDKQAHLLAAFEARKKELQEEISHIDIYLRALVGEDRRKALDEQLHKLAYNELRTEFTRLNERAARLTDQLNAGKMLKGKLQNEIEQLISDQSYTEQLQKHEELLASFQHLVGQWASRAFCLELFKRAKEVYEREKQPGVLKKASEYFAIMTERQYLRVMAPIGEKTIRVERANGEVVDASFLSRGTAEQLYLAMRFALADQYAATVSLPIVMDDIMVNFDPERLHNTLTLLATISRRHQLILFTCHPHIREQLAKIVPELQCVML